MNRAPESSPLFRLLLAVAAFVALLALSLVGPDVDEHNLNVLREFVRAE